MKKFFALFSVVCARFFFFAEVPAEILSSLPQGWCNFHPEVDRRLFVEKFAELAQPDKADEWYITGEKLSDAEFAFYKPKLLEKEFVVTYKKDLHCNKKSYVVVSRAVCCDSTFDENCKPKIKILPIKEAKTLIIVADEFIRVSFWKSCAVRFEIDWIPENIISYGDWQGFSDECDRVEREIQRG